MLEQDDEEIIELDLNGSDWPMNKPFMNEQKRRR